MLHDIADKVTLIIRIRAKKGSVEDVISHLYETISPTHKEEGCLSYNIYHDANDIHLIGTWKNQMSLDMHLMFQYHLQLIEEKLPPLCKKIKLYQSREIEPPITALSLS